MKPPPTVADIARHLDVSPGTVSKALNNRHDVSEETRLRVLDAARELNYPLRSHGRYEPSPKQVKRIGLVSFGTRREQLFGDYVYGRLIHAIEREAAEQGWELILEFGLKSVPRSARSGRIDAAIVLGSNENPQALRAMKNLYAVCVPNAVHFGEVDCVCQDAHRASEMLAQLLIDRGHRRIAFVARDCLRRSFREMSCGYGLVMRRAGLEPTYVTREDYGDEVEDDLARRVADSSVTAVIAGNDNLAVELMRRWAAMGLEVPRDLSVVGCENYPNPRTLKGLPLTTIDGDLDEVGVQAIRLLQRRFERGGGPPVRITVHPTLIEGRSVAPPAEERRAATS